MFDLSKYDWKSMLTWHFLWSVKLQSPLHASAEGDRRKTVQTSPSVGTAGEIWARLVINLKYNTVNRMLMIDLFGLHHSEYRKSSRLLSFALTR